MTTRFVRRLVRAARVAVLGVALARIPSPVEAQTVQVTVPASVTFNVTNVSNSTTGTPNPVTFSFSSASLTTGSALRVSLRPDASNFTAPAGTVRIAASRVSWTTSGASGGTGYSGTANSSSYATVFQSQTNPSSGSLNIRWTLSAPGANHLRSGAHTLTMRWRFESITP